MLLTISRRTGNSVSLHSLYFFPWIRMRPVDTNTVIVASCSSIIPDIWSRWITIFSYFEGVLWADYSFQVALYPRRLVVQMVIVTISKNINPAQKAVVWSTKSWASRWRLDENHTLSSGTSPYRPYKGIIHCTQSHLKCVHCHVVT